MKTVPDGKTMSANVLSAPAVTPASADSPSGETISASVKPTTDCVARASTMGQASARSFRRSEDSAPDIVGRTT
jgi:hypothetical protein